MADTAVAAPESGAAAPPPAPLPNGHDTGGEKTYTVSDTRSAGDAIAGLLFNDDGKLPPDEGGDKSGDDRSPDRGADETPPTAPEDDKGNEQPDKPAAIEPPASWSADERAAFSSLPPALQQTVARRESQREATLTQKSQEAAEARRAMEGERQAAVNLRSEYLAGLQKMMRLALPQAQALENVDWVAIQAQSPAEYTRLQALREETRSRLGAIEAEFQQNQAQTNQYVTYMQNQQLHELVQREHGALNEAWPDFGDEAKGGQLRKDLSTYLRDAGGFSDAEISKAYDHRLVVLATKAMLYDRQHTLSAQADAKRNNVPARVRPPGNSQEGDTGSGQGRLRAAVNRLGRTNSVRDAGSLISELL